MAGYNKREPFISNPQLFMDYYTNQAGVGDVRFAGLGNQFGCLQSRVIPLRNPKNRTDSAESAVISQPVTILSPTQAATEQARAQIKWQRLIEKEITAPTKRIKKKQTSTKRRKGKERDLLA